MTIGQEMKHDQEEDEATGDDDRTTIEAFVGDGMSVCWVLDSDDKVCSDLGGDDVFSSEDLISHKTTPAIGVDFFTQFLTRSVKATFVAFGNRMLNSLIRSGFVQELEVQTAVMKSGMLLSGKTYFS